MPQELNTPNAVEQAISRALRENLERIQRTSDELHQAIGDVVAACGSSKPTNALPAMLRAQAAAASLTAVLDVLTRFVAATSQPGPRSPAEEQITSLIGKALPETPVAPHQRRAEPPPVPMGSGKHAESSLVEPSIETKSQQFVEPHVSSESFAHESVVEAPPSETEGDEEFDVNRLSSEEQELHRRANRVAKVSMQDIKMLHPEQVRLGRQNKDICIRLKDDIEKAHREYDRRFKPIMDHPVDYFYRWMVEILAEGDAHALGEYPYATMARRQ